MVAAHGHAPWPPPPSQPAWLLLDAPETPRTPRLLVHSPPRLPLSFLPMAEPVMSAPPPFLKPPPTPRHLFPLWKLQHDLLFIAAETNDAGAPRSTAIAVVFVLCIDNHRR